MLYMSLFSPKVHIQSNWAKDWAGAKEYLRVWNHVSASLNIVALLLFSMPGLLAEDVGDLASSARWP